MSDITFLQGLTHNPFLKPYIFHFKNKERLVRENEFLLKGLILKYFKVFSKFV